MTESSSAPLIQILPNEVIKQVYDDGLSPIVKEAGLAGKDIVKALRLFTAPFQFLAHYQDNLIEYLNKARNQVPYERQIEASATIAGPILERFKYLEPENHLTELYINLLARAIDKERVNEAHPAFLLLIEQLSPDEALILFLLKNSSFSFTRQYDWDSEESCFKNSRYTVNTFPYEKLTIESYFSMYISHLSSLNLVEWPVTKQDGIYDNVEQENGVHKQIGSRECSVLQLTNFGKLFVTACVPEQGFSNSSSN